MNKINYLILLFSIGGLLFSGYLSSYKLFNKVCALGETCPSFLGQPACYFGFLMYFTLTLVASALVAKIIKEKLALNIILLISALGILFSGYYTVLELPLLFENGFRAYALGLPTCALGLIFYMIIFSLTAYKRFYKK